jgi:hypothetical protein
MNEKMPSLELWLPDIKKYIFETAGHCLSAAGYNFIKSDGAYRRIHAKNYEEFCFVFANQFPVNYRIGFLLQIWNHQIKTAKSGFPQQEKIDNYKLRSIVLFINNFTLPEQISSEQLINNAFLVVTNKDLFVATENITHLLQEQAIPLADQLCELDGIDSFFADRPGWSVNSLNFNNITSELAAAKLNNKRNIHEIFQQILAGIDQKILQMEMGADMKENTIKFYEYLNSKY